MSVLMRPLIRRGLVYGVIVWCIPFVVSLPFFGPDGRLWLDVFLFKSIMIVLSSTLGSGLMADWLGRIVTRSAASEGFERMGARLGLAWLAINWLLDLIILLPLSGMSRMDYLGSTGLRYAVMPITGLFMGRAVDRAVSHRTK